MKIVMRGPAKFVKYRIAGFLLVAFIAFAPVAAFSQEDPIPDDPAELAPTPSTTTDPWANSAGASVGTPDNNASSGSASSTNSGTATAPRLARPTGPTIDDRDPDGNPDVPFDDNMNLAFLAAGILFAVFVIRKKFIARVIPVTTKE